LWCIRGSFRRACNGIWWRLFKCLLWNHFALASKLILRIWCFWHVFRVYATNQGKKGSALFDRKRLNRHARNLTFYGLGIALTNFARATQLGNLCCQIWSPFMRFGFQRCQTVHTLWSFHLSKDWLHVEIAWKDKASQSVSYIRKSTVLSFQTHILDYPSRTPKSKYEGSFEYLGLSVKGHHRLTPNQWKEVT